MQPAQTDSCARPLQYNAVAALKADSCALMQSGFQNAEVLGVIPLPPLPDQDLQTAKKQLESFRSEAGSILEEANAADDLAAPLAVAAAEAENLTLDELGKAF